MSSWHLHVGDCIEYMRTLPDKSVDVVPTDPPYSATVHSKSRAGARAQPLRDGNGEISRSAISRSVDFGFQHLSPSLRRAAATELARLTRRWIAVFCDVESTWLWRLSLMRAGLEYIRTVIWVKEGCTPQFTGDRPAVGCEAIVLAHPHGRKRWNGGGKRGVYSVPIELDRYGHGNVVRTHPTQKPLVLMSQLVADFTDPGETILDPFTGSGTTGSAALRHGRRFLGAELDPTFAASAAERLRAEDMGLSLGAARAGQEPLFGKGAA
jgi:DNA modification methylase